MRFEINTALVLQEVYQKGHFATQAIEDAKRDFVRPDDTKKDEIDRCLLKADSMLRQAVDRWLVESYSDIVANRLDVPGYFDYELDLSERRMISKETLAELFHSALVHFTLSEYYKTVGAEEQAKSHAETAGDSTMVITTKLYMKRRPL